MIRVGPCFEPNGTVGGRNGVSPYRLQEPEEVAEGSALPDAEVKIADGVTADAATEQTDVGGFPSNRIMLGLKIKF